MDMPLNPKESDQPTYDIQETKQHPAISLSEISSNDHHPNASKRSSLPVIGSNKNKNENIVETKLELSQNNDTNCNLEESKAVDFNSSQILTEPKLLRFQNIFCKFNFKPKRRCNKFHGDNNSANMECNTMKI